MYCNRHVNAAATCVSKGSKKNLNEVAMPSKFKRKECSYNNGVKRKCTEQESVKSFEQNKSRGGLLAGHSLDDSTDSSDLDEPVAFSDASTQKDYDFFSIDRFKDNDQVIEFYTGFENFKEFQYVLQTTYPQRFKIAKCAPVYILSFEDGFFLTLIKLRQNKPDFELALLFNISIDDIFGLFETWLQFMYDLWLKQNLPQANMNHVRMLNEIIHMDATEIKHVSIMSVPAFIKDKNKKTKQTPKQPMYSQRNNTEETPITIKGFRILDESLDTKYLPLWPKIYFACCIICGYKEGRNLKKT